jgi:hypothetical protein
MEAMWSSAPN